MLLYTEEIHISSAYNMTLPCLVEINFYKVIAYSFLVKARINNCIFQKHISGTL